ncbi:hypothetical protein HYQ46_008850 [Verticillium longisporum]|nr:hypothetical protein HYQ46_008850 [Verticillium longisporum]
MPEYLLRERWDGGIASDDARKMRRARGEFTGVLPWQTKKWREFYGLEFGWVLAEAMGTGRLEVFETGSVGRGFGGWVQAWARASKWAAWSSFEGPLLVNLTTVNANSIAKVSPSSVDCPRRRSVH